MSFPRSTRRGWNYHGLIYLSAVTEDELFSTPEFAAGTARRKVLFLHGEEDERIPCSLIRGSVAFLKHSGCDVRLKIYKGEDHFLLFSQPDAVTDEILACMATIPKPARPH
jgi:dipeptidyl aminopeptidase/acylaminoacyl peptidase